ncbi:hypothetical protein R6Q57_016685 [Mikania cordata]
MKDLLDAHVPSGGRLGRGHKGLYDTINNSIHFQLGLALASLGVITSLVAQHMYSLPAYAFIAQDFTTQAALYTHHQYIAGFIMTGAFAHGAIFFIRDYNPEQNEDNVLARMLEHKEAIISHLSWASLFLGFHTLGLYVHNDVMLAFGTLEKQIIIEPIFAQWIQSAHGKTSYGFDILLSSTNGPAFNAGRSIWLPGWLNDVNENSNSLFLTIGPGDFLVHHAIALDLHTTTLILVKGALDARGSKLMPDKKDFGYSFPCDGPHRGGTCDISAWDAFYLAVFWMLNTIGWVTFYWHSKHITLWQVMAGELVEFQEGTIGIALNLESTNVGVVLMGDGLLIQEGSSVKATGRIAQIPVSEAYLGRVINALAKPIDGRGEISSSEYRLIESPAPRIISRRSVYEPLQTWLIAIDSMIPIGRGQ